MTMPLLPSRHCRAAVEILLSAGADPNKPGEFGRTPLFRACFLGRPEVLRPLLEAGADPRAVNDSGAALARWNRF